MTTLSRSKQFLPTFAACCTIMCGVANQATATDFTKWSPVPAEYVGGKHDAGQLLLESGVFRAAESQPWKWVGWFTESPSRDLEVRARVTITRLATDFGWFGQSWSVWPDLTYGDGGFEAGIGLAIDHRNASGYRVQFSHKYQSVALVRYPLGGYVRVVACPIEKDKPLPVEVVRRGREIRVRVDGKELIQYLDPLPLLPSGHVGLVTSSRGAVRFSNVELEALPPVAENDQQVPPVRSHRPKFSARKWLGDHPWVFDGDEPILMLPIQYKQNDTYYVQVINSVKLRPGLKPMLMWNAHWDIAGQGAWKEGGSKSTEPQVHGGGTTLRADWQAKHYADRFRTKTTLTIGFDNRRGTYTYDMDSQLEILPGPPFHIQAFELEHHTPLDPFHWKYLVIRKSQGELVHRPLFPIDPGPTYDIAGQNGLRLWYGRHNEPMVIAPAVEYAIEPSYRPAFQDPKLKVPRKISTAVCAAFYDTGIAYDAETLPAGTVVRSRYRYTGYPAEEADRVFKLSKLLESPRLDPNHHYVWADPWPRLRFAKGKAMSEPWWDAQMPIMTAHNQRPTYKWAKNTGTGSGFALELPPRSYGQSDLPLPKPLAPGRYIMRGLCKAERVIGPGGRIELRAYTKDNRKVAEFTHYLGNGDFDWKPYGFVFALPGETARLNVAFGNAGTGDFLVGESCFEALLAGSPVPPEVAMQPQSKPAQYEPSPQGALFDARLTEGKGHYAFNFADPDFPPLELCNVTWETVDGRTGLRFSQKVAGDKPDFARGGTLEYFFFAHDAYKPGKNKSLAISGSHGSPQRDYKAMTLATWIRPAAEMTKGQNIADILGFGSRRVRLHLLGEKAPYQFGVRFTEGGELIWSGDQATLNADRWHHVAITANVNVQNHWEIKLYIDGKQVQRAVAKNSSVPLKCHDSIVLGTELHYMQSNHYHGLIGRTLVFDHALRDAEIEEILKSR